METTVITTTTTTTTELKRNGRSNKKKNVRPIETETFSTETLVHSSDI